jgi:thioredoxin reductase (NADPH)
MSLTETRSHQMFPVLDLAQIATAKRFANGEARHFTPAEVVYDVGGSLLPPGW